MNFKNLSILVLLALVSFTSCSNDDDDKKETTDNYYFLPTLTKDDNSSDGSTIEYNADRQIVKKVSKYTNEDAKEIVETYTVTYADGKPSKIIYTSNEDEEEGAITTSIAYNGNTVTLTKGDYNVQTITINDKGYIQKIEDHGYITTFEYDATGRVVKTKENGYASTYTYDNENGLLKDVNNAQWFLYVLGDEDTTFFNTINNVLAETYHDNTNTVTSIYTNTYTYNEAGFPTNVSFKEDDKTNSEENENGSFSITYTTVKK